MFRKKLGAAILVVSFVFMYTSGVAAHARYHRHHHSKVRKIAGIAAPIGIGMALGPGGSIGYQVVKHRHAIKKHLRRHRR